MYVAITDNPLALFFTNFSFDFSTAPSIFLHGINNIYDINNPANTTFKLVPTINSISPEDKTLTSTSDDDSKDLQNLNTTVKDYTPTKSEIDSKINDLKDWTNNNYTPRSDMSNYAKTSDINALKDWTNNNYVPRSELDLSSYAKIADVNTAFNELANVIEGV